MRRIKLVVAVGVVMAAILALSAGPAMADEWDEWNDWNGHPGVDDGFNDVLLLDEDVFDDDRVSPFFFGGFVSDCPFAGDFEGIVNQFDYFDDGDVLDDGDVFDGADVVFLVEADDIFDEDHFFDDNDNRNRDRDNNRRHRG